MPTATSWLLRRVGIDATKTAATTRRHHLRAVLILRPTTRLRHAGPRMFDCQPRRAPGVACSRFVRRFLLLLPDLLPPLIEVLLGTPCRGKLNNAPSCKANPQARHDPTFPAVR